MDAIKKSTGKFDGHGEEIFVGDRVVRWWGMIPFNGVTNIFRFHTIVEAPSWVGGDGKLNEDAPGIVFKAGKPFNSWTGKQVTKIVDNEPFENLEDDIDYIWDGSTIRKPTTAERYGMKQEEVDKWEAEMNKIQADILWSRR